MFDFCYVVWFPVYLDPGILGGFNIQQLPIQFFGASHSKSYDSYGSKEMFK